MIHDVVFPFLSLSAIRKNDDLSLKGNASCQARESLRVLLLSIGVPVKKNWGGGRGHIFGRRILKFPDGSKMNQNIV